MKIRTLSYALALTSLAAASSLAQTSSSPASTAGQGTSGATQGTVGTGQRTPGTERGTVGERPATTDTQRGAVGTDRGTATKAAVNDALFAAAAASGGMAEVALAEIGARQATDPDLKAFSQQMIADHTRMNGELMALAAQRRMALPRTLDFRAQFCAQSLMGVSGADFDRCYAKAQCLAHMETCAMFEAEAERGQDPAMKALAAKALPKIKEHLKMIKPIAMKYEKMETSDSGAKLDAPATGIGTDRR